MSDAIVAKRITECEHVHGLEEFQRNCARTAPVEYGVIQTRLNVSIRELYHCINEMIRVSKRVDKLKKHLFYGKELGLDCIHTDFIEAANDVIAKKDVPFIRLIHAVLGLGSESG